tara:strand:- start:54 stop:614 length:561 start_codon:yes stop_codon:yes gene_type:complete
MTAKALHNKESGLQKYGCIKNAKGVDSNRARLEVVASEVIQEGIDNPVNDPSLDIWPDDSEEDWFDSWLDSGDNEYNEHIDELECPSSHVDSVLYENPLSTEDDEFSQFMGMTENKKREYLDEAFQPSANPFAIFDSKDVLLSDSNHVLLSFVSEFSVDNATVSIDGVDMPRENDYNSITALGDNL